MNNAYKDFSYYYDDLMEVIEYDLWYEFILPYINKDSHILDLACGTGTLALILASANYQVSGLDLSEKTIYLAKEKAKMNHLEIDFQIQDMTSFKYSYPFDVITCFFDSVNFLTSEQIPLLFDSVYQNLKTNGYFIFDLFTKAKLEEVDGDDFSDDLAFASYNWKSKVTNNIIEHHIRIDDGVNPFTEKYYEYYHDYKLLLDERFELVKMVTDFSNDCDLKNGERLLIVLRKK